jgi:hypothetical protein
MITTTYTYEQLQLAIELRDNYKNECEYRVALVFLFITQKGLSAKEVADIF